MCSGIVFLMFKILELLKVDDYLNWLVTFGTFHILSSHWSNDYNFASLFVLLLVLYTEIKRLQKTNEIMDISYRKDILLGILARKLNFT